MNRNKSTFAAVLNISNVGRYSAKRNGNKENSAFSSSFHASNNTANSSSISRTSPSSSN